MAHMQWVCNSHNKKHSQSAAAIGGTQTDRINRRNWIQPSKIEISEDHGVPAGRANRWLQLRPSLSPHTGADTYKLHHGSRQSPGPKDYAVEGQQLLTELHWTAPVQ
jgi:hypothetical protein